MLGKLAYRNVKRQTSSYLIYFITVVFTVSLMFAVNNILYSDELRKLADDFEYSTQILVFFICFVALVVGFVVAYATAFLLRKRKKEFGTYLLLGIKRSAVLRLFVIENLIVGAVSFALGCVLGLGVFQILNYVVCAIIGGHFGPLGLAPDSFVLTLLLWTGIFLVSILYSGYKLGKSTITVLVKDKGAEKKQPRKKITTTVTFLVLLTAIIAACAVEVWFFLKVFSSTPYDFGITFEVAYMVIPTAGIFALAFLTGIIPKKPKIEQFLAFFMLALIIAATAFSLFAFTEYINFWKRSENLFNYEVYYALLPTGIAILISAIFLFYFFSRSFYLSRLAGNKKLQGSNIFHYRQMSSALTRNAAIMGMIAVLLSFSLFFTSFSLSSRYLQMEEIDSYMPFDVIGWWENGETEQNVGSVAQMKAETEKYSEITFSHEYNLYHSVLDPSNRSGEDEELWYSIIKESDLNVLMRALKKPEFSISDNGFYVIEAPWQNTPEIGSTISISDKELKLEGIRYERLNHGRGTARIYDYFIAVPDSLLTESQWEAYREHTILVMNTKDYLPPAFVDVFSMRDEFGNTKYNVRSKYLIIDSINVDAAVTLASVLYLGVTFIFIAMAILSLKVMSDADLDKKRYAILSMLGTDEKRQRKIMFRQILTFFAAPMAIPLFMAFPSALISALWSYFQIGFIPSEIYMIGITVPLIYTAIYACYFAATYYLSVRNNIKPLETPRVKIIK